MAILVKLGREIINFCFYLTMTLLLFLGIRNFIVQPFQVEGQSMDPTLHQGYQMLLNRISEVERFDIVVFPDPMGSGDYYVKRLIGLPGDSIEMVDDKLIINGQAYDEPYLAQSVTQDPDSQFTGDFTLWEITGQTTVPEGYYFVLGDNRPESGDSRQFGFVPIESVQGTSSFVYFPFDQFGSLATYQIDPVSQTIISQ